MTSSVPAGGKPKMNTAATSRAASNGGGAIEEYGRATLDSRARGSFTDDEWDRARQRLLEFYTILREVGQEGQEHPAWTW